MTWQRLEAGNIDSSLEEGLEARIADPLWMLSRQWQVGEFHGEDAASPVFIQAVLEFVSITGYRPGKPGDQGRVYQRRILDSPLETMVEREQVLNGISKIRLIAEAGLLLYRSLVSVGINPKIRQFFRQTYPLNLNMQGYAEDILELDSKGKSELGLLVKKSFDATKLIQDLNATGNVKQWLQDNIAISMANALQRRAVRIIENWQSAWEEQFSVPESDDQGCWDSRRMEYRFQIAAKNKHEELQFNSTEYDGKRLDWYSFDMSTDTRFPLEVEERSWNRSLKVLPTTVRYSGMPADRWWECEDRNVWFGDIDTAPEDLARSIVAGFATTYGNDWFIIPCTMPLGTIARVKNLEIRDDYGETHSILSCSEYDGRSRPWRFFEITGDTSADAELRKDRRCPWMLLPPVIHNSLKSKPLEEVKLIRDEASNLAWAIENKIESPSGRRIDRQVAWMSTVREKAKVTPDSWRYLLAASIPDHYVPLLPIKVNETGAMFLQRGRVASSSDSGKVKTLGALGQLLEPDHALLLHEEEIPTAGAEVKRYWQLSRDATGKVHLWLGRQKGPVEKQRNHGTRFDALITEADNLSE